MKKLDKKKRHFAYIDALSIYKICSANGAIGICCCLDWVIQDQYGIFTVDYKETLSYFPEVLKSKPENAETKEYWWDVFDYKIRIEFLEKCIKLTK